MLVKARWWMNFNSLDRMSVHSQPMGISTRNPESSYTIQATEAQVAWWGSRLDSVVKKIPKHWKNLKFLKSLRTGDVPTAPVTVHLIHEELSTAGGRWAFSSPSLPSSNLILFVGTPNCSNPPSEDWGSWCVLPRPSLTSNVHSQNTSQIWASYTSKDGSLLYTKKNTVLGFRSFFFFFRSLL